jgi:hypothetical protein
MYRSSVSLLGSQHASCYLSTKACALMRKW